MTTSASIKTVLLIAVASVCATGFELAGIDSLAAPREPIARQAAVQLPTVVITAQREARAVAEVRQLPRMVIVGHRESLVTQSARSVSQI